MSRQGKLLVVGNSPLLAIACQIAEYDGPFVNVPLEPSIVSDVDVVKHLGWEPGQVRVHAAIGLHALNHARSDLVRKLGLAGYSLQSLVHPAASVASSADIGANVLICAGASIGPDCAIGEGTVILDGARVEAGARVGQFAWLGANVVVGFGATLGEHSILRSGVNLDVGVSVGDHCELSIAGLRQKPIPAGVFETSMFDVARVYCGRPA